MKKILEEVDFGKHKVSCRTCRFIEIVDDDYGYNVRCKELDHAMTVGASTYTLADAIAGSLKCRKWRKGFKK